jgi:hypothetical protein
MLLEHLAAKFRKARKKLEEQNMTNKVNVERLTKQIVERLRIDVEKLKDATRDKN